MASAISDWWRSFLLVQPFTISGATGLIIEAEAGDLGCCSRIG